MRIWIPALLLACVSVSRSSGQIIYQPIQYQYGTSAKFYYGGADPTVIEFGLAQPSTGPNQVTIYSDARPYENVAIYGYTISDARNEAYANVPRYFRKRELLAAAQFAPDGSLVIGAQSQPNPVANLVEQHPTSPAPILIIPRGQPLPPPPQSNNVKITLNRR
jgi:hypothetical protein